MTPISDPVPFKWSPFWDTLSKEEWHELFETSRLTGETLARYWRMSEWQGEMPQSILIEVYKPDIDRLIRDIKRRQRKEKKKR